MRSGTVAQTDCVHVRATDLLSTYAASIMFMICKHTHKCLNNFSVSKCAHRQ